MWKKDAEGNIVVDDKGNPIWIDTDGKEKGFDVDDNAGLIASLRKESIERRQTNASLESKLKEFDGIDPKKAREAIALAEKGGNETTKEVEERYERLLDETKKELGDKYESAQSKLHSALLANAFSSSEFLRENTTGDVGYLQYLFGKHFKVQEDGTIVCSHDLNNPDQLFYSKVKPTQLATFDESISTLINDSDKRDHLLKTVDNKGGGVDNKGNFVGKKWSDYTEAELGKIAESQPELFDQLVKTREIK